MKHASLKDTIHISMGEFSGILRHCKTLSIIPTSSKRRALLDDQSGAATTKKGVRKPSDQRGFRR